MLAALTEDLALVCGSYNGQLLTAYNFSVCGSRDPDICRHLYRHGAQMYTFIKKRNLRS